MVRPGKLHLTPGSVLEALVEKLQSDAMFALLIEGDADSVAFALESLRKTSTFVFAVVGHVPYLPLSKLVSFLTSNRLASMNRDDSTMT